MTAYRILIADPLLQLGPQWPAGCKLVRQLGPGPAGTHWHMFDDPDAPAELDGREVDLTLARVDGEPRITARRPVVTHQAPEDDSGLMPCCRLPAWELPRSDRMSQDAELVTCPGIYMVAAEDGPQASACGLDVKKDPALGGDS